MVAARRVERWLLTFSLLVVTFVAPLLGQPTAAAAVCVPAPVAYAYDAAACTYDAPALLSSQSARRTDLRGSPPAPEVASWGMSASTRGCCTAAETGAGVVESSVARTLTAAEQRSVASLQRQVAAHTEKLGAYRANPDAYDNLGFLERAPSPEIRQQIIDGRINHLETEMRGFQDQIDKILGGS